MGTDTPERQDDIYRRLGLYRQIFPPRAYDSAHPNAFTREIRKTYSWTTENISVYVTELDLDGKRVACIAGSGDFPINAYLYGAAHVDAVDISPVACLFGELKLAGLRGLSFEEFLDFFATTSGHTFGDRSFSLDGYRRLRSLISETAQHFFDALITEHGRSPLLEPGRMLITNTRKLYKVQRMNPYLQGAYRFKQAKQSLKPTLFYPQSMDEFLVGRASSYDIVHLSNIHGYANTDMDRTIAATRRALLDGGKLVFCGFTEEVWTNHDGWTEFVDETEKYGLKGRSKVGPDGFELGSIKIYILDNKPLPLAQSRLTRVAQKLGLAS